MLAVLQDKTDEIGKCWQRNVQAFWDPSDKSAAPIRGADEDVTEAGPDRYNLADMLELMRGNTHQREAQW